MTERLDLTARGYLLGARVRIEAAVAALEGRGSQDTRLAVKELIEAVKALTMLLEEKELNP